MYCFQCGKEIPNNSKFCNFCGACVDSYGTNNNCKSVETSIVNQQKLAQDIRKGTLVYLRDILSMEFSIHELQRTLKVLKEPMIIHDDWFYWKCYNLSPPILWYDFPQLTKLYLCYSYKQNRYYYSFEERAVTNFYDHNGNEVHHRYGRPGYSLSVMDQKTRDKLCTLPVFKKKIFSGLELMNSDSVYFGAHPGAIRQNYEKYGNLNWFAQIKRIIEQFESSVQQREETYQKMLPGLNGKIQDVKEELAKAKRIRDDLYSLNIVPSKYRNIGCSYFIYDYFSTSNTPLNTVFLHLDLDKIQSQLNTVIKNQGKSILQQAIIISQNEELIAQNQQLFEELSNMNKNVNGTLGNINATLGSISENSVETSQWAKIAALNAETCAWISFSNYIKR